MPNLAQKKELGPNLVRAVFFNINLQGTGNEWISEMSVSFKIKLVFVFIG